MGLVAAGPGTLARATVLPSSFVSTHSPESSGVSCLADIKSPVNGGVRGRRPSNSYAARSKRQRAQQTRPVQSSLQPFRHDHMFHAYFGSTEDNKQLRTRARFGTSRALIQQESAQLEHRALATGPGKG